MAITKPKTSIQDVTQVKKADYAKHLKRVQDIISKAKGSKDKELQLAKTMADSIDTVDKAYGRYLVSIEQGYEDMAEIFLTRYKQLTQTRGERISLLNL